MCHVNSPEKGFWSGSINSRSCRADWNKSRSACEIQEPLSEPTEQATSTVLLLLLALGLTYGWQRVKASIKPYVFKAWNFKKRLINRIIHREPPYTKLSAKRDSTLENAEENTSTVSIFMMVWEEPLSATYRGIKIYNFDVRGYADAQCFREGSMVSSLWATRRIVSPAGNARLTVRPWT